MHLQMCECTTLCMRFTSSLILEEVCLFVCVFLYVYGCICNYECVIKYLNLQTNVCLYVYKCVCTLQHTATHCNILQHTATHSQHEDSVGRSLSNVYDSISGSECCSVLQYVAVC